MPQAKPNQMMRFAANIELRAADSGTDKPKRIRIVGYSGDPYDFGMGYFDIVDLAGLKIPDLVTVLVNHDNSLDSIIAQGSAQIENGALVVNADLINSEAAQQVTGLLSDGVQLQASISFRCGSFKPLNAGETVNINGRKITVPKGSRMLVWTTSRLIEVSVCPIGMDPDTSVQQMALRQKTGGISMPDTTVNENENQETDAEAIRTAERKRLADIDKECRSFGNDPHVSQLRARAIDGDMDVNELRSSLLSHLRRSRTPSVGAGTGFSFEELRSDRKMAIHTLSAGALILTGHAATAEKQFGAEACNRASDLRLNSTVDLCSAALRLEGRDVPSNVPDLITRAFSTTSLPQTLSSSAEKTAAETFMQTPATWRSWAKPKPVRNFKTNTALRPYLSGGSFEEVGPGGEIKHASVAEQFYTHAAQTRGKMFTLTRQNVINDDLGLLMEFAAELGRQGIRSVNDRVYAVLLGNASSFFATGNSNYLTGGSSALSDTSLKLAIKKLRTRTDADGSAIDVTPKILLVGPSLEFTAKALVSSATVNRTQSASDGQPEGNPLLQAAQVEVESRLENTAIHANASATRWYLFADPAQVPALVVSFLNGIQAPTVEQVQLEGNVLGVGFRGYMDFGADLAESRGGVMSDGA